MTQSVFPGMEEEARDESIAQGLANAKAAWKAAAYETVEILAAGNNDFTADDVTDAMDRRVFDALDGTHDLRALGGVLNGAKAQGIIVHVGYHKSQRKGCHAGPRSVWRGAPDDGPA